MITELSEVELMSYTQDSYSKYMQLTIYTLTCKWCW